MSKGLEALHHPRIELASIDISAEGKHDIAYMPFYKTKQYAVIEEELKEYEGAKNHIEALHKERIENSIKIKALELIKETRVDTNLIKLSKDYDDYCSMEVVKVLNNAQITKQKGITQEEYDLLKEVLL